MSFLVQSPFPLFEGTDGQPLEDGYIYIGTASLNPQANPVSVYWDSALTIPAAQPIRTTGGYPAKQGGPGRIYTAANYSILVQDKKQQLVFSDFNAGITALTSGMVGGVITDLNFDPTLLGLVTDEVRLLVTSSAPTNPPAGAGGTYYLVTLAKVASAEYRVVVTQGGAMGSIWTRTYAAGVWGAWNANGQSPLNLATGTSPYTIVAGTVPTIFVSSTTNPYIINLPQTSGATGFAIDIVNTTVLATGLVKIVPFAGDKIGPMPANVAIYLQDVDQSAWQNGKQRVRLMADGLGTWSVNGQWMPEPGSVDAAGSQYYLGKIRHLPLGNVSSRAIQSNAAVSVGAWSSALQVTGLYGVPSGAKAVRLKTSLLCSSGGNIINSTWFSDVASGTPGIGTAHPQVSLAASNQTAGPLTNSCVEIDVPLNASGQFFEWTNVAGTWTISTSVIAYYMGD